MLPFIGLSVATAPGFAHYLGFLRPLAESDGFGSGMAQGFVPAIAIALAIGLAVLAITRKLAASPFRNKSLPGGFARQTKIVSRTRQRALAYHGTFYFTVNCFSHQTHSSYMLMVQLFTTLLWLLTATALEYAVQGFDLDVQQARSVGDGAIFSS